MAIRIFTLHGADDRNFTVHTFLNQKFGRKRWSPFGNRWRSDELDKERKQLLSIPRNSVAYKAARAQWFKTIRNAKRECLEEFLQQSDTDAVWKTMNAKPACHAMPTLHVPGKDNSVKLASTHQKKVAAISAISFTDKDDDPIPPIQDTDWECHIFNLFAPRV
jgi:hypothetical protein